MTTVLIVLSAIAGVIGIFTLSQATAGVGGIAVACLFGIYARIHQAYEHNREKTTMLHMPQSASSTREVVRKEDLS